MTKFKTAAEREQAFRDDLEALLNRHGAEISITEDGTGWGPYIADIRISMDSIADADTNEITSEFWEFKL